MVEYDFIYENKRLKDFGFMMAKPENEDTLGVAREIVKGNTNSYRSDANHYNVKYSDALTLPFMIVKDCCKNEDLSITRHEVRSIQAWLTSAKTPRALKVETFEHEVVEYYGLFTEVTPFEAAGLCGMYLTFTCDSPYAYETIRIKVSCSGSESINFLCDSDELNEYVYPVITINPNSTGNYSIKNSTTFEVINLSFFKRYTAVVIDCKNKIITADGEVLNLSDVGFTIDEIVDVNNMNSGISKILWIKLSPGDNKLEFSGNGIFTVKCKVPMKVGGFIDV